MKAKNKELIRARAQSALENMYHNATPRYPRLENDAECDVFESWFYDMAQFEIRELNSGGAYPLKDPEFRELKSERAREYARRKYHNDKNSDQWEYAKYELITQYGKLYQYGRGGRTVAPDDLIENRGGGGFGIISDYGDNLNMSDLTELVLIIESFNRYVNDWNYSVPDMWMEHKHFNEISFDEFNGKKRKIKNILTYE